MDVTSKSRLRSLKIVNFLVCCFVCWPFVWSLWSYLRVPTELLGTHFAAILIFFIAFGSWLSSPMKLKTPLNLWLLFYFVTLLESRNANMRVYINDLGISLSAWLVCATAAQRDYDSTRAVKCIRVTGMIAALSVVLENTVHLFTGLLSPLYISKAFELTRGGGLGGGLFPYSSYAGCFIVPGLAALIIQEENRTKNRRFYIETAVYLLSLVLIRKRGFILDIVLGSLFLWYLDILGQGKIVIRGNKSTKRLISVVAFLMLLFAVYHSVPFIREALDSFLAKFYEEDGDFSGRGSLYALAFSIFRGNMLTGIGWGQFRALSQGVFYYASTKTYEVHNVYLQLLCENGIVGLLAFLLATGRLLLYSSRKYIMLIFKREAVAERRKAVKLAVFLQVFFLTYCISGNPLYDYNFAVTYFIGVLLAFA